MAIETIPIMDAKYINGELFVFTEKGIFDFGDSFFYPLGDIFFCPYSNGSHEFTSEKWKIIIWKTISKFLEKAFDSEILMEITRSYKTVAGSGTIIVAYKSPLSKGEFVARYFEYLI